MRFGATLLLALLLPLAGCLDGDDEVPPQVEVETEHAWVGSTVAYECGDMACPTSSTPTREVLGMTTALDGSERPVAFGWDGAANPIVVNADTKVGWVMWNEDGWHRRELPPIPGEPSDERQRIRGISAQIGADGALHVVWKAEIRIATLENDAGLPDGRYLFGYANGTTEGDDWEHVEQFAVESDAYDPALGWVDGAPLATWYTPDGIRFALRTDETWEFATSPGECLQPELITAPNGLFLLCTEFVQDQPLVRRVRWQEGRVELKAVLYEDCSKVVGTFEGNTTWLVTSSCSQGPPQLFRLDGDKTRVVMDLSAAIDEPFSSPYMSFYAIKRDAGGTFHLLARTDGNLIQPEPEEAFWPVMHVLLTPDGKYQEAFTLRDDVSGASGVPAYTMWRGFLGLRGDEVHAMTFSGSEVPRTNTYVGTIVLGTT